MKTETPNKDRKLFKYIIWVLTGYIGILTGYHAIKILQYYIKPLPNPLMPLDLYKYIAFPYLSFIPPLLFLISLGLYFIKKEYFKKGYIIFYVILILIFHLSQTSLLNLFDTFNPYGG